MKKLTILLLLLCCAQYMSAQKMTDDQVVEYVMTAQEKGMSQQEIAKDLLRRGVSMDQVNRIKRKMESQNKNGMGSTLTEKMRTRIAPKQNGAVELQSDKDFTQGVLHIAVGYQDVRFCIDNALMLMFAFRTAPLMTLEMHAAVVVKGEAMGDGLLAIGKEKSEDWGYLFL